MGKLMDKYAKLLGHQNQRQKIHYINKLKEEYMQCRKVSQPACTGGFALSVWCLCDLLCRLCIVDVTLAALALFPCLAVLCGAGVALCCVGCVMWASLVFDSVLWISICV